MKNLWTFGDSFTAGHGCKHFAPINKTQNSVESNYQNRYANYIDETKQIWPEIVAEHFGLNLKNMGINGLSNESISDYILKTMNDMSSDDIVIIQSSTQARYDFPFQKEKKLFGGFKNFATKTTEIYGMDESPYFFRTIFVANIQSEWNDEFINLVRNNKDKYDLKNMDVLSNKLKYNAVRNFFTEFIATEKYYDTAVWRFVQISNILSKMGIRNYIINEVHWPNFLEKPLNLIEMNKRGITGYIFDNKQTIKHETSSQIDDTHPGYTGHIDIAKHIINRIENENIDLYNS